jgi:hypothetical protein
MLPGGSMGSTFTQWKQVTKLLITQQPLKQEKKNKHSFRILKVLEFLLYVNQILPNKISCRFLVTVKLFSKWKSLVDLALVPSWKSCLAV